jgi:hypothetical protein
MSVMGMKWAETKELSEEDREFLLSKVEGIKSQMRAQAEYQAQHQ